MIKSKLWRVFAALFAFALLASACGSDSEGSTTDDTTPADTTAEDTTPDDTTTEDTVADDEMAETADGVYDLGGGAVLDTNDCGGGWDPVAGLTDDEIRIGISLPSSGPLAGFGTIADGLQLYFDNAEPIDGRKVTIIARDDGYDPGRTKTNIEEMIDTENVFAFSDIIGSPNNLGIRDLLGDECIPQLFNATGLPEWGDPENYPWTIGGLLPYNAEARIWCDHLESEIPGGTVAALYADSDFGKSYQTVFEQCAADAGLEIVETQVHDPNADNVTNEVTTLAASGADAFVVGTTGASCPRAVAGSRAGTWRPLTLVSTTCANVGLFWAALGESVNGIRIVNTVKDIADERWADDPWVVNARSLLEGAGVEPGSTAHQTGFSFAEVLEASLRAAAATDEGLNRATLMQAAYQLDFVSEGSIPGAVIKTDGVADAYIIEAGEISELNFAGDVGSYSGVSDLIDREGEGGSFGG